MDLASALTQFLVKAPRLKPGDRVRFVSPASPPTKLNFRMQVYNLQTQARLGNRGEALRANARLRELLKEELGKSPSAETERIYLSILQA